MKILALSLLAATFVAQVATASLLPRLPKEAVTLHKALYATECDPTADIETSSIVHHIGTVKLFLVPCLYGAYNSTSVAYLQEGGRSLQPLMVLTQYPAMDDVPAAIVPTAFLTDAVYDDATMTLSTYSKGRGMGDCGVSSATKFTLTEYGGVIVKTTEIRSKPECDGNMETEWPIVFQQ